ncbi:YadA-like family protein [Moraxella catarrhalis]
MNQATGHYSAINGGLLNQATGDNSTVAGGSENRATGEQSTISGGAENRATAKNTTISGGEKNQATNKHATVSGGTFNQATGEYSTVGGGHQNQATDERSTVSGGIHNQATGNGSTVAGGQSNHAKSVYSTVSGGLKNQATGIQSTVAGGSENQATGIWSTIAGGSKNQAKGNGSFAAGVENQANTDNAVAVGKKNIIEGENSAAIGSNNTVAQDKKDVFILGSNTNTTNAQSGSVLLGNKTAGKQATAVNNATVNGLTLENFAGTSAENGVVSVGHEGGERQIVNVGAGQISATSTDAVNGSQLHALATAVSQNLKAETLANRVNIKELERKQENDIKEVVSMQNAIAEQADKNTADIAANKADADAKFKGVQTDIANNKITLAEHAKKIDDNQRAIEAKLGGKADLQKLAELKTSVDKNQADITKNTDNIQNLKAETLANRVNIKELERKQENDIKEVVSMQNAIAEQADKNTADIAANKADADAKFKGVQTDIANNKITLAEHAKKIDDNQRAIEAKLGGKADLQKLAELKTSVDKNQADITKNTDNIQNLKAETLANRVNIKELERKQENDIKEVVSMQNAIAEQADKNTADIAKNQADIQTLENNVEEGLLDLSGRLLDQQADISAVAGKTFKNQADIAKNKADADASFETLTKNQNTLIEQGEAQDALIAQNKTDITANKTAIEQNVNRTVANGFEIEKNKAGIAKNQADIVANKADADANFETLTKNQNALAEQGEAQDALIAQNQTDITANKTAIEQNVNRTVANGFEIEKNKAGIATNKQELIIQNNRLNRIDETNNRQDQKIDQLGYALKEQGQYFNSRISAVERQTAGGIANAIAIATLPSPNRAGEHHVLFGSGYHNGQAAVSLGAAGSSDTGKSTYKIGLSWSDAGGLSGGVGGSYRWK